MYVVYASTMCVVCASILTLCGWFVHIFLTTCVVCVQFLMPLIVIYGSCLNHDMITLFIYLRVFCVIKYSININADTVAGDLFWFKSVFETNTQLIGQAIGRITFVMREFLD